MNATRQHFYLDHPGYLQFGEPTDLQAKPLPTQYADLMFSEEQGRTDAELPDPAANGISTTTATIADDHLRAWALWLNDKGTRLGILDNDW